MSKKMLTKDDYEGIEDHKVEPLQKIEINIKDNEVCFFSQSSNLCLAIIKKKDSEVDFLSFINGPFCKKTKKNLYFSSSNNKDDKSKKKSSVSIKIAISMPKEYINIVKIVSKDLTPKD